MKIKLLDWTISKDYAETETPLGKLMVYRHPGGFTLSFDGGCPCHEENYNEPVEAQSMDEAIEKTEAWWKSKIRECLEADQ